MKKIMIVLLVAMLVFMTACQAPASASTSLTPAATATQSVSTQPTPAEEASPTEELSLTEETTPTDGTSAIDEYYEPNGEDLDEVKSNEPKSDNSMAICNLFPDPYMAYDIAQLFNKKVNDTVTFRELASYTGELDCYDMEQEDIKGIGYMTGITTFSCSKTSVTEIPDEIGNLQNLKKLHLQKAYGVETLSPEIKKCTKLEELWLNMSSLNKVPAEIGQLKHLKSLGLGTTPITSIPPEIGNCSSLVDLDIHDIDIDSVPDSICSLSNLKFLDISHTKLKSLPQNMGNLKKLEVLNLFGDQLKTLPQSMKNLKNLTYLNVYDNFKMDEAYKNWFPKEVYTPDSAPPYYSDDTNADSMAQ